MTVLILAQEADAPVDAVVDELNRRGVPIFRACTSWFPRKLTLDARMDETGRWTGMLATDHRAVELDDIRAVWHRDPAPFAFPESLTQVERAFCHREARLGLGGVLAALRGARWVNNPNRAADSMYKPLQLAVAAECGLRVMPTIVTNSPAAMRRFAVVSPHGVVTKALGSNTVTEGGVLKVAYTHRLIPADLDDLGGVRSTATQAQWWARKSHEARVIVVGERMFTILIRASSEASMNDWRADPDALAYEWVDTPPDVEAPLRAYMKAMGLAYAAVDLVIGPDEHDAEVVTFLESNSGGQYYWLEAKTGAPITAALADLLAGDCR